MATSKLFKKVPVTVPNRSGFNMSHNNFFTAPVGTLVPSHIDFLIPGDKIDLSSKIHVQLPPMATDFYGRIEAKEEAFFVPCRILFGGWKDFFVNPVDGTINPSNIDGQLAKYLIGASGSSNSDNFLKSSNVSASNNKTYYEKEVDPSITLEDFKIEIYHVFGQSEYDFKDISGRDVLVFSADLDLGPGTLADYLGFKVASAADSFDYGPLNYKLSVAKAKARSVIDNYVNSLSELPTFGTTITLLNEVLTGAGDYQVSYRLRLSSTNKLQSFFALSLHPDTSGVIKINNILPFLAYHKIYDDWYRAPMIQQSLFKRNVVNQSASTSVANMPWITSGAEDKVYFSGSKLLFANGVSLFDLHQRNWQKDYFTSATPEPQAGEPASVKFEVTDGNGEFTIASLRAANALQQWLDRNNIGGFRYGDLIYAQYGVYPSDAITDRAIYLGSSSVEIYNKSIFQQSGDGGTDTNNPFNAIGSKYSNPMGVGEGNFCNNYEVTEAGFVVKIFSLVPTAYYSTGVRRMFNYNDISDIAFPVLAGVGDQPIYNRELTDIFSGTGDDGVFGYVQRYAEYKFIDDQVHGLLRDGNSLDSFALQRSFTYAPELGSDFLKIPRDYLDQVSATKYKLSQYGCWVNCYNSYYKSSTLPAYSIPTLEDMKGHTVLIDKGGKYLD